MSQYNLGGIPLDLWFIMFTFAVILLVILGSLQKSERTKSK